jgi:hypothetical protein
METHSLTSLRIANHLGIVVLISENTEKHKPVFLLMLILVPKMLLKHIAGPATDVPLLIRERY